MQESIAGQVVEVAIIGAGFGGLGAGAMLRQRGIDDFVILERNQKVGGTWYENSYPGCQCDVQSDLYSFSFAPNPDWSRTYSPQSEIQQYLHSVAENRDLLPKIRFGCSVQEARWDAASSRWRIDTNRGLVQARFLILAHGAMSAPAYPDIEGLDEFGGEVLHSARWDHAVEFSGKRVGVIGTGASAIQIVPALQPLAKQMSVFQRTPAWIVPRYDKEISDWTKTLYRTVPLLQRLSRWRQYWEREFLVPPLVYSPMWAKWVERWARRHLHKQVKDVALRARLRPQYRIGCKRILLSNDFYPAMQQPNVELVTDSIQRVTRDGVQTADGRHHQLDALVLATGFRVADHPFWSSVVGAKGETLAETWSDGAAAYLGISVPNFPNMFLLAGPNTGIGHTSLVFMLEAQVRYALSAMQWMKTNGTDVMQVTPEACSEFTAEIQRRSTSTTWAGGSCHSWYLDAQGRNSTIWPGFTLEYWWRTRSFNPALYSSAVAASEVVESSRKAA
ncbi:MAG: NAD(P)/FAD-dependent oxidoreductase [Planctomycetaceae bacterium]|nr:NAD(P)/FAD-dependent oxidoreductase [Planctomycetaceae bacterium]